MWGFLIINHKEIRPPEIDKELGISLQQKQELDRIRSKMMAKDRKIFLNILDLNKELHAELARSVLNDPAITSITEKLQAEHRKLAGLRVTAIVESRKVLGQEKFLKMTDLFENKRKKGLHRGRNRPDFPGKKGGSGPPPPPPGEFGF